MDKWVVYTDNTLVVQQPMCVSNAVGFSWSIPINFKPHELFLQETGLPFANVFNDYVTSGRLFEATELKKRMSSPYAL